MSDADETHVDSFSRAQLAEMDLHIGWNGFSFYATDWNTYDGAPDSGPRAHCIGYGKTRREAVEDLLDKLAEFDEESNDDAHATASAS